jgi:hypothetical protein
VEWAFEENEVVKDLNGFKAMGSENFSMAFFQSCWDVIKVFPLFHGRGMFEKSLNATFTSLS